VKAYISKSNLADYKDLIVVRSLLEKHKIETSEYLGGRYSVKPIEDADLMVGISYPEAKEGNHVYVGKGVYSEIETALSEGLVVLMYDRGKLYEIEGMVVNNIKDYVKRFGKIEVSATPLKKVSKFFEKAVPIRKKKTKEEFNFKMI